MRSLVDMEDKVLDWAWSATVTVVSVLAGAVAMLWKLNESKNSRAITALQMRIEWYDAKIVKYDEAAKVSDEKHQECLKDREDLRVKVGVMEGEIHQQFDQIQSLNARLNISDLGGQKNVS